MKSKLTIFSVLVVMILTACGNKAPATNAVATATVANTQAAVMTDTPAPAETAAINTPLAAGEASATPANGPTVTSTPEPPRPTNVAGCTNTAKFVADVTIPDNTPIDGGAEFVKTWRVLNSGTCIWASDYKLAYYSEERMNAPATVPLAITYPGQTLDISVTLTAPNSVGSHRANFVLENPDGLAMKISDDSRLWLIIQVGSTVASTVAAPAVNTATVAVAAATDVPVATAASGSGGGGLVTVSCGYSIDQSKLLDVIAAINAYRSQFSMFAYPVNPQLAKAAQAQANDMACNSLTGHAGSDGSTVESRVTATGYTFSFVDENIYNSNPPLSGQDVVNQWINDTTNTHNKLNLVSDTFTEFGIGYAFFNNSGYYVIVFAAPK